MMTIIVGFLAAVGVAGTGISQLPKFEPYIPALRVDVRWETEQQVKPLQVAQDATSQAVERLLKFQLEETQRRTLSDPAYVKSPELQRRNIELQQQIDDANKRLNVPHNLRR